MEAKYLPFRFGDWGHPLPGSLGRPPFFSPFLGQILWLHMCDGTNRSGFTSLFSTPAWLIGHRNFTNPTHHPWDERYILGRPPFPSNSHQSPTRISTFLVGDPDLNFHFATITGKYLKYLPTWHGWFFNGKCGQIRKYTIHGCIYNHVPWILSGPVVDCFGTRTISADFGSGFLKSIMEQHLHTHTEWVPHMKTQVGRTGMKHATSHGGILWLAHRPYHGSHG